MMPYGLNNSFNFTVLFKIFFLISVQGFYILNMFFWTGWEWIFVCPCGIFIQWAFNNTVETEKGPQINITGLSIITLWFYCARTKIPYFDTKDANTIILKTLFNNVNAYLCNLHMSYHFVYSDILYFKEQLRYFQ